MTNTLRPSDPDALITAMRACDGRTVADLTAIHTAHHSTPDFLPTLVDACAAPEMETAATWLIKHHCETGQDQISKQLGQQLLANLPRLTKWDARLHLLQLMQHLPIPAANAAAVFSAVTDGAASSRPLLRAWSLYGAAQLATQHPQYAAAVQSLLDTAARDTPRGAVAVRLRKAQALMAKATGDV